MLMYIDSVLLQSKDKIMYVFKDKCEIVTTIFRALKLEETRFWLDSSISTLSGGLVIDDANLNPRNLGLKCYRTECKKVLYI